MPPVPETGSVIVSEANAPILSLASAVCVRNKVVPSALSHHN